MNYEKIIYEKANGVATVWFNQPEYRNAWTGRMGAELISVLKEIEIDPEIRVVILTGKGTAFSAGAFLKDQKVHSIETSIGDSIEANYKGPKLTMDTIAEFPKPIIAAINGQASGFGFRIALCCDILIAAKDAKMNLPEVSLGIIPGTGGSLRLARFVGKGKAMEMILTAEWIDAWEAHRVGLVSQVVPNSDLLVAANKLASRIASLPPIAVVMAKRSLNEALDIGNMKVAAQTDIYRQLLLYQTEDTREAHQAWRDKRTPKFKNK